MDDSLKSSLLKSIELTGSVENVKVLVNQNLNNVIDKSSGKTRLKASVISRFKLILSFPALNPFEIRCLSCKRVISFPAWHHSIKFAVNQFHYFLCFNRNDKPSLDCKGR